MEEEGIRKWRTGRQPYATFLHVSNTMLIVTLFNHSMYKIIKINKQIQRNEKLAIQYLEMNKGFDLVVISIAV